MGARKIGAYAYLSNLPTETAAYIAGLIDADGTITATGMGRTKAGRPRIPAPLVLVVNGNLDLIRWLRDVTQAGCAYETKSKPQRPDQNAANWNKVHRFQLTCGAAQALLARVRPWLRVKARQADLVLALPAKGRDFAMAATDEQREAAAAVLAQIRALNVRGIKA